MHHDDSLFIIDLPRHWRQARLWGALAAVALAGCPVPGPMPQRDAGATPDVPLRPTDDASVDAPRPSPARLEVSPASLIVSAALDEVIEQTFVDELGVRATLPGTDVLLALDDPRMGTIDATGHFASGPRSTGTAQLTATYRARTLNVPIEIRRSDVVLAGGATAADADFFETLATDPALEVGVVYPLDGVVMPQDAAPMEIQWTRGALADLYRIRFTAPHAEFTVLYREVTHRRAWRVDASLFRLLAQADPNEPIAVAVDRFDAASGRAIEGAPRAIRFAPGVLRGNVYYWDASSSGLRRIAHGGTTAEVVDTGGRCVGCHAISPDGHTIAVRYDASSGPGGFVDVATGTSRDAVGWYFASFAPTGDRLIVDTASMALELVDVETGSFVAAASAMLPRSRSANPAWAPNGRFIAFVTNIDVHYRPGFDSYQDGDLALLEVTGPDTFGAPSVIVDAATLSSPTLAPYRAINQPTWSPDSSMIVFAAGPYSNTSWANALYAVRMDGEVATTPVRLDAAMGGPAEVFTDVARSGCSFPPTDAACCHDVYHGAFSATDGVCVMTETDLDGSPRFSPFFQGGYFWVVFSSRRAYGNELAGSPRAHGVGRPQSVSQLWVAAIDPSGEFDPSFAPYWLPGQDPTVSNIDAQWAPGLCVSTGDRCDLDGDCCSGVCSALGVCETPPPDRCHGYGETCSEASDCCGELLCTGRLCSDPLI